MQLALVNVHFFVTIRLDSVFRSVVHHILHKLHRDHIVSDFVAIHGEFAFGHLFQSLNLQFEIGACHQLLVMILDKNQNTAHHLLDMHRLCNGRLQIVQHGRHVLKWQHNQHFLQIARWDRTQTLPQKLLGTLGTKLSQSCVERILGAIALALASSLPLAVAELQRSHERFAQIKRRHALLARLLRLQRSRVHQTTACDSGGRLLLACAILVHIGVEQRLQCFVLFAQRKQRLARLLTEAKTAIGAATHQQLSSRVQMDAPHFTAMSFDVLNLAKLVGVPIFHQRILGAAEKIVSVGHKSQLHHTISVRKQRRFAVAVVHSPDLNILICAASHDH
mmetsp:Transcript_14843/g.22371  ORF Transcript_14843/g.22371 Transcript_14843/m.22371 type:complete len:335 (-) Transcript_14843:94-1098(-)